VPAHALVECSVVPRVLGTVTPLAEQSSGRQTHSGDVSRKWQWQEYDINIHVYANNILEENSENPAVTCTYFHVCFSLNQFLVDSLELRQLLLQIAVPLLSMQEVSLHRALVRLKLLDLLLKHFPGFCMDWV